jgi:HAD superfamily hydrolase (TIGR01509 family)
MKKKYILWDHDGVLVDTEPLYFKANRIALSELGIELSRDEYLYYMQTGETVWSIPEKMGVAPAEIQAQRKKRNEYYREFLRTENIEIPHVVETLEELKKQFSMAIVTTSKKEDFELIHKDRNILRYMDFYLVKGDYQHSKPAPDPYLTAMRRFDAAPAECLVVEDSARGLKSALTAGIDCIIVKNEFTRSHDFTGAMMIVESIRDLIRVIP